MQVGNGGGITAGDVLIILSILGSVGASYFRLRERLTAIEVKLNPMWEWWLRTPDACPLPEEQRRRTKGAGG